MCAPQAVWMKTGGGGDDWKICLQTSLRSQPDWPGRHRQSVVQVFLFPSLGMTHMYEHRLLSVIAARPDSSLSLF